MDMRAMEPSFEYRGKRSDASRPAGGSPRRPAAYSDPIPYLGDPEVFLARFRERWEAKRRTIETVAS
jgi:hypothetical protein